MSLALPCAWSQQSTSSAQNPSKTFEAEFEKGDDGAYIRKRAEWFNRQRAYPNEHIPPGVRLRALQQVQARLAAAKQSAEAAGGESFEHAENSWQLIGPAPVNGYGLVSTGRITAVAVDPTNPNVVYAGAAEGGIWKTTDGGQSWVPLTDSQVSLATGAIAIDPQNHNIIYVGTGEENNAIDNYYGAGILKSTDGGLTWTNYPGPFLGGLYGGATFGGLAISPANSNILLAGTSFGAYRSADGGQTWTLVLNTGLYPYIFNVIFNPRQPNIAYASSALTGVYKSVDGGLTWNSTDGSGANVLPLQYIDRVALAMDPNQPNTLYAGISNAFDGSLVGLYQTRDAGNNWYKLQAPDYCYPQCWYDNVIAVAPGNSNNIVIGGAGWNRRIFQSLDGGRTWQAFPDTHPDLHALAFTANGAKLYLGDDGGMYSTTVPAGTFTSLNSGGLATIQFYSGPAINPDNPNMGYAGTQDNGLEQYSGSTAWNIVDCGDGGPTAIDLGNPSTAYVYCVQVAGIDIERTTDNGTTFQQVTNGINQSDIANWVPPLVIDPSQNQILYFGTQLVYQSIDHAASWVPISPPLTFGSNGLSAIAVSPVDSNTVYVTSSYRDIYVTHNALSRENANWADIGVVLPDRAITAIAADPQSASTAYVTFSGFTDNYVPGHVFITTNSGTNWTNISGDLPDIPVNGIVVDPVLPNTIYIATDIGMFYTTSNGLSWARLSSGLPNVAVLGIAYQSASHTLWAATHGRSMWALDVTSVTPVPAITSLFPSSAQVGGPAFILTVNGSGFIQSSIVQWNGTNLPSTYVSSNQITAQVPANDLGSIGTAEVDVVNPGAQVTISNTLNFQIIPVQNPFPVITSIYPTIASGGNDNLILMVSGANFIPGNSDVEVQVQGVGYYDFSATVVNSTFLYANIAGWLKQNPGVDAIRVFNNPPGGGYSNFASLTIIDGSITSGPLRFIPMVPCRVADTRNSAGLLGGPSLVAGSDRDLPLRSSTCGIPSSALAYSLNVTVIPQGALGFLTIWPSGQTRSTVSTMNSLDGRIKANAAVVFAGTQGAVSVYPSNNTDMALDINGYFVPAAANPNALAFYPLTPCRVFDTRGQNGRLGGPYLQGGQERDFPLLQSTCQIPASAQAYSMNFTAVPVNGPMAYLTVWPTGQPRPAVSTLNNVTATIVANAAIVSPDNAGTISVYPSNDTHLVGDINGYFAAPGQGGLSLNSVVPCRVLDTRQQGGDFVGELTIDVLNSTCRPSPQSQAYLLNATVIPQNELGYLTLWPDGESRPMVSTLNATDGWITSNMAIVATMNGKVDAYVSGLTQLILDISAYFAP